jgi:phage FluMu protein gp41
MESVTLKLRKPISVGSKTIDEVTVREMRVGDLRSAPNNDIDRSLHVIAKVTGLSSLEVDQLSLADMEAISKVQERFQ